MESAQLRGYYDYNLVWGIMLSIAFWLLVITVVYSLLCEKGRDKIDDVRDIRDRIRNDINNIVVPCCEDIPENCTCNNSIQVETPCWDADTNTPNITSGDGEERLWYVTCEPGSHLIDGNLNWLYGDYLRFENSTSVWYKNEAQIPASPFLHETYVFTMNISDPSGGIGVPGVAFFNLSVDLFIINDLYVIVHVPYWEGVPPINVITCPGVTTCTYNPVNWKTTTGLPANRRPPADATHYNWRFPSNCRASPNVTDECQQCGGTSTITTPGLDPMWGLFTIRSTSGVLRQDSDDPTNLNTRRKCYGNYQFNFMYTLI